MLCAARFTRLGFSHIACAHVLVGMLSCALLGRRLSPVAAALSWAPCPGSPLGDAVGAIVVVAIAAHRVIPRHMSHSLSGSSSHPRRSSSSLSLLCVICVASLSSYVSLLRQASGVVLSSRRVVVVVSVIFVALWWRACARAPVNVGGMHAGLSSARRCFAAHAKAVQTCASDSHAAAHASSTNPSSAQLRPAGHNLTAS